jgi:hypothetical protein
MSRPKPSPWRSSPPCRSCRLASSPCSSCATSSASTPTRWPTCSTRPSNRSTAPSNGPAPASSAYGRRAPTGSRPRLTLQAGARGRVRPRLRVRGSRRAGRLAHRRYPPLHATDSLRKPGRDAVARLFASIFGSGRRVDLVPTRANGQPAFGGCLRASTGIRHGTGLFVLTLTGDRICAFTRFDNSVLPCFGLPRSLPSRSAASGALCIADVNAQRQSPDVLFKSAASGDVCPVHCMRPGGRASAKGNAVEEQRYTGHAQTPLGSAASGRGCCR